MDQFPDILIAAGQLTLILGVAWFGTRHTPGQFRLGRVFKLSIIFIATSLPFCLLGYVLRKSGWEWGTGVLETILILATLAPIVTLFIFAFQQKGEHAVTFRPQRPEDS